MDKSIGHASTAMTHNIPNSVYKAQVLDTLGTPSSTSLCGVPGVLDCQPQHAHAALVSHIHTVLIQLLIICKPGIVSQNNIGSGRNVR